jgi:hypothetical protein
MKTEVARGYLLRGANDQKYKINDKHLNFYETYEQGKKRNFLEISN